jgi:hypothetical protein
MLDGETKIEGWECDCGNFWNTWERVEIHQRANPSHKIRTIKNEKEKHDEQKTNTGSGNISHAENLDHSSRVGAGGPETVDGMGASKD